MGKLKALRPVIQSAPSTLKAYDPERFEADRRASQPWRKLYKTQAWQRLRIETFARDGLACQWPGCGFKTASIGDLVCDHVEPHRGDERLFFDASNVWTLCKPCHDGPAQAAERAGTPKPRGSCYG